MEPVPSILCVSLLRELNVCVRNYIAWGKTNEAMDLLDKLSECHAQYADASAEVLSLQSFVKESHFRSRPSNN